MGRSYRINLRFDPEDLEENAVLEELRRLQAERQCSLSKVIIEILKEHHEQSRLLPFTLEEIRQVIREELDGCTFSAPVSPLSQEVLSLTEEEQVENAQSVLRDMELFG